jgi:hypothetical protein
MSVICSESPLAETALHCATEAIVKSCKGRARQDKNAERCWDACRKTERLRRINEDENFFINSLEQD